MPGDSRAIYTLPGPPGPKGTGIRSRVSAVTGEHGWASCPGRCGMGAAERPPSSEVLHP